MLEIGTIARVRDDLVEDQFYGGNRFHYGMNKYKGLKTTIIGSPHYDKSSYRIEVDCEGYDWSREMLKVVE